MTFVVNVVDALCPEEAKNPHEADLNSAIDSFPTKHTWAKAHSKLSRRRIPDSG